MSEVQRHVVISGRVQGVGYRAWTEDAAARRGLRGWVRNRRDGTVEAVFVGAETLVMEMIRACRRGPQSARVIDVDVREATGDDLAELHDPQRGNFLVLSTV